MSASGGTSATYGYDANGNTTTLDYTYGPFARLLSAGGTDFVLSAGGQRLEKTSAVGTTYFASSANGTPMAEHQSTNGLWLDYVWLNGKLVTVMTSDGGVYPVHDDQTGRPIAMTNLGNQSIIWQAQNLPFMRNVTATTRFDFNIGFPGQYFDSESGLSHNGQRDYDATLGRYIESDPIGLGGGVNTYVYAGGDPVNAVDATGLVCWGKLALGILSAAGGTVEAVTGAAAIITGVPTADPVAIAGGGFFLVDGAANVEDGIKSIGTAFDGQPRTSTFHDVGQELGGSTGARIGDEVALGASIASIANSAAGLAGGGGAAAATDLATGMAAPAQGALSQPSTSGTCGCH